MNEAADFANVSNEAIDTGFGSAALLEIPPIDDSLAECRQAWLEIQTRTAPTPTGLSGVDRMFGGGLRAGDFIGIAGPAKQGKSALLMSVLRNSVSEGAVGAYISTELDEAEIYARLLAMQVFEDGGCFGFRDILGHRHSLDQEAETVVLEADQKVQELQSRLGIYRLPPGATVEDVRATLTAIREVDSASPLVAVVDPLQRLYVHAAGARDPTVASAQNKSAVERVGTVAVELKQVATDLDAAILFASDASFDSAKHEGRQGFFRDSYVVHNAVTASAWLHTGASMSELENTAKNFEQGWASDPDGFNEANLAGRAGSLGAKPALLRFKEYRMGEPLLVPLLFVPGSSAFYDGTARF